MKDKPQIRGPDSVSDQELKEEIQVMIIFVKLIEQEMEEFIKKQKSGGMRS